MGRDIGPKDRQSRRIGEKLFLKGARDSSPKGALVKRAYPPGIHGQKGANRKISEYGKQLLAKQKIKKIYRLRERQFSNYFAKAQRMKGDVSTNLLQLLESRFDNVIYRLGLADSRDQARQLVNHGHFLLNNKKSKIPSIILSQRDKIAIREKSKTNGLLSVKIKEIQEKNIPDWLNYDAATNIAMLLKKPDVASLKLGQDATLTIEFYSR